MKWQSNCAVCVKRENCNTKKELEKFYPVHIAIGCSDCIVEQPTNADRIRAMSDEELADMFVDVGECDRRCPAKLDDCIFSDSACRSAWLDWLKSPVEVDNGD